MHVLSLPFSNFIPLKTSELMRTLVVVALGAWLLIGCGKTKEDPYADVAYYKFSAAEFARIPKYKDGDSLIYKSQTGETKVFKVANTAVRLRTRYEQGVGFFGPSAASYFFYDLVSYDFMPGSPGVGWGLYFDKFPINIDSAKAYIRTLFPSRFHGQIHFPAWNESDGSGYRNNYITLPNEPNATLQINNTFYPEVAKIMSVHPDTTRYEGAVHTIYYAFSHGIVGFDDVKGRQWRLQ